MNSTTPKERFLAADRRTLLPLGSAQIFVAIALLLLFPNSLAQSVLITAKLDQSQILTGAVTTLHIYGQIAPAIQAQADRIFSWHVDLLNLNPANATAEYSALKRPKSDNDPQTSSAGQTQNSDRIGIYDTFLQLPAAGKGNPVELFSVPLTGVTPGIATFRVRAGTGSSLLSSDFLVARTDGGEPFTGGDYSAGLIDLEVVEPAASSCQPTLHIQLIASGGAPEQAVLSFDLCPGADHIVEASDAIGGAWQAVSGAPHNSGFVTNDLSGVARFFRVRVSPR